MPNEFESIQDFDAAWAKKMKDETAEVVEETKEDEEELVEEVEDSIDVEDVIEETEDTEETKEEPVVETKEVEPKVDETPAAFAYKKLREEAKAARDEKAAVESKLSKVEAMAISLGYKSVDDMHEAFSAQAQQKEATAKGVDPAFYKEFRQQQVELEALKNKQIQKEQVEKEDRAMGDIEGFVKQYSLSEKELLNVLGEAAKLGYTSIEDLSNIKGLGAFLRGVASDLITEKKVQAQIQKMQTEDKFVQEKHKGAAEVPTKSQAQQGVEDAYAQYGRHFKK